MKRDRGKENADGESDESEDKDSQKDMGLGSPADSCEGYMTSPRSSARAGVLRRVDFLEASTLKYESVGISPTSRLSSNEEEGMKDEREDNKNNDLTVNDYYDLQQQQYKYKLFYINHLCCNGPISILVKE